MSAAWSETILGEKTIKLPIPDLSVEIPTYGVEGCVMVVTFEGNADSLTLKIGLDFCLADACLSSFDAAFPVYLIKDTYVFSGVCGTGTAITDNPSTPASAPVSAPAAAPASCFSGDGTVQIASGASKSFSEV
jgi:hypothetical protein